MKPDYSKLSKPQLKAKIAEFTERIMFTYPAGQKEKQGNRKRLKKEIARLKTELNRRRE